MHCRRADHLPSLHFQREPQLPTSVVRVDTPPPALVCARSNVPRAQPAGASGRGASAASRRRSSDVRMRRWGNRYRRRRPGQATTTTSPARWSEAAAAPPSSNHHRLPACRLTSSCSTSTSSQGRNGGLGFRTSGCQVSLLKNWTCQNAQ